MQIHKDMKNSDNNNGRPNRGTGSAGPKRPNNGGNKKQYSIGGIKSTK